MAQGHAEDVEAVKAVLAGSSAAFRPLVDRHKNRVFAVVLRMVNRAADAEDLTQQTFLEAYSALSRYDPTRPFGTWLLRIAVNNCKDFLKSHKRREVGLSVDVDAAQAWSAGRMSSPESATSTRERLALVASALAKIDEKYRLPLVLKDVEELSYQQMKEILELPVTTLKIRVVRARSQLQELLQWTSDEKS